MVMPMAVHEMKHLSGPFVITQLGQQKLGPVEFQQHSHLSMMGSFGGCVVTARI